MCLPFGGDGERAGFMYLPFKDDGDRAGFMYLPLGGRPRAYLSMVASILVVPGGAGALSVDICL
jgi:hypothetical protein